MPKWRIMARSLGKAVALQRLVIDKETISTVPTTKSETSVKRELEQNDEQHSKRDRKHFTPNQEHSGQAWPKQDSQTVTSAKRRQTDSATNGATTRTPASQPERSFSSKERYGRRGAGRQSSFGRTTGKHRVHAFATVEPKYRTARRKPRATSTGRLGREGASNRSASR